MRDATKGTYNGETTYCPVNAYGACPYCDQCNVCHNVDPLEHCDDWQQFWSSWFEWEIIDWITSDDRTDFAKEEIEWAHEKYGYNPS